MTELFHSLGGTLLLGVESRGIRRDGPRHIVDTAGGELIARQVISTQPRLEQYPPGSVPGLHFAQILLAVKREFAFPPGIQTVFHIPKDVAGFMTDLDQGRAPAEFGFQVFRTLMPAHDGAYSVGSYFLMPRGELDPTPERKSAIEQYFFSHADRLLPGLQRAIVYKRFLSPADFARFHQMPSALMPLMAPAKWRRPSVYDPATGIHYTRPAIDPPNNTGMAVVSGTDAAERIQRALASLP